MKGAIFWSLKGDRFDGNQYAQQAIKAGAARAVVDDPQIAATIGKKALLVEDSLLALQQLANHHRLQLAIPVLALTGSNGKTTTKELIAAVMARRYRIHYTQGNYNNHIGLPLTILAVGAEVEMLILEMGANHQGEIAALCRIAAPSHGLITNIGEAHLEGFGGIEGVKKGKGELYDYLEANKGIVFVNLDAAPLPEMAQKLSRRVNYVTAEAPTKLVPEMEVKLLSSAPNVRVAFLSLEGQLTQANTQLLGEHNFENVKAAIAVGKYFKVPAQDIAAALEAYLPENNRSQRLHYRGIDFLLDAYNANPSSTAAALRAYVAAYPAPRVAVLGAMLELGETSEEAHFRIAQQAKELGIDTLVLVGDEYAAAATQLALLHFPDAPTAKAWFWEQNWEGYTVLLKASRGVALEQLIQD